MSDHNECPTCTQDWVEKTDYECGCCGRPASEHIRVTSLCRILRETQQREHKERALADRLAEGLRKMVLYSEALILRIQDRSDINFKTLNEGIDLFNEWKEARND